MMNKRLRKTYAEMKQKCYNPNSTKYFKYGAKGIKIHFKWLDSYDRFEEWAEFNGWMEPIIGMKLKDTLTIDRIDPKGDYQPNNCQIITYSENSGKDKRKFTDAQICMIRNNYKKIGIKAMSTMLDVSYSTIHHIVNNKTYKHVSGKDE